MGTRKFHVTVPTQEESLADIASSLRSLTQLLFRMLERYDAWDARYERDRAEMKQRDAEFDARMKRRDAEVYGHNGTHD